MSVDDTSDERMKWTLHDVRLLGGTKFDKVPPLALPPKIRKLTDEVMKEQDSKK